MNKLEIPALARVEGEGGLYIGLKDGEAVEVRLDIYEPPRFFEGFLSGRYLQDVPDITARICGICPVAYQMSAVLALENALSLEVSPEIHALRRLMYCGEYIESHALHIYMLQAPDLLGQPSALELAAMAPEVVRNALRMKKAGNAILSIIGGRSVHPVNACVGGFYHWPDPSRLQALLPDLEWALENAQKSVTWAAALNYPELVQDYEFVALHHPERYATIEGEVWSSKGSRLSVADFESRYFEEHVQHSNALHGYTKTGGHYLVGPLARLNLNHDQLLPVARQTLTDAHIELPLDNPHKSLIARSVELVQAFAEAIQIIQGYEPKGPSRRELKLKAGEGSGASEAPRGLLYHRYKIDDQGRVTFAKIVPPTAQNLPRIEQDLSALAPQIIDLPQEQAALAAEKLIRAYDPCISCATHFLKLKVERKE